MSCFKYPVLTFCAAIITTAVAAQAWVPVGQPGFSSGTAAYTSIAINSTGIPYVVYADSDNTSDIIIKKFDGNNWVDVGEPPLPIVRSGAYTTIAIGKNDVPYIAYQDVTTGYHATVMKFSGGKWLPVGKSTDDWAEPISIAIDKDGTPYLAFGDVEKSGKATVMKFNGHDWVVVGAAGFSYWSADYTAIAIDGSGTPYVVYRDNGYYGKVFYSGESEPPIPVKVSQ